MRRSVRPDRSGQEVRPEAPYTLIYPPSSWLPTSSPLNLTVLKVQLSWLNFDLSTGLCEEEEEKKKGSPLCISCLHHILRGFVIEADRSISSHSLDPGLWITWWAVRVGLKQHSALTLSSTTTTLLSNPLLFKIIKQKKRFYISLLIILCHVYLSKLLVTALKENSEMLCNLWNQLLACMMTLL